MADYDITDGSISGHPVPQEASPGDLNTVFIRRGVFNSAIQNLANAQSVNVIQINAGEIVLDVWARMVTAESTANADCDLGFGEGSEVGDGLITADSAANTVFYNANFTPYHFANANAVTIFVDNGVALDTAKIEVCALITKSFSSF